MSTEAAERVAVIGGGMMGAGVAQVFAAAGHEVALQDVYRGGARAGAGGDPPQPDLPGRARAVPGRRGRRGRRPRDAPPPTSPTRPTGRTSSSSASSRTCRSSSRSSSDLDAAVPARDDPGHQHLGDEHRRDRQPGAPQGARRRHALLEPAVPHPAGRGRAHPEHVRPAVVERTMALLRSAGKHPIDCKKDVPGFVANRLQHALWREAIRHRRARHRRRGHGGREHPLRLRVAPAGPGPDGERRDGGPRPHAEHPRLHLPATSRPRREPSPLLRRRSRRASWASRPGAASGSGARRRRRPRAGASWSISCA